MSYIFKEINEKILKFNKDEQIELIKHYVSSAIIKLHDTTAFNHKKLLLLMNILLYAKDKNTKMKLIQNGLSSKIKSVRTLILDLININFTREQKVFYKPDKWVGILLKDIKETFAYDNLLIKLKYEKKRGIDTIDFKTINDTFLTNYEKNKKINNNIESLNINELELKVEEFNNIYSEEDVILCLDLYNEKLCKEFMDIFCSCDKFNTSGNQLILNFVAYIDKMSFLNYDFASFMQKIRQNFNENKALELDKIIEYYKAFKYEKHKKANKHSNNDK